MWKPCWLMRVYRTPTSLSDNSKAKQKRMMAQWVEIVGSRTIESEAEWYLDEADGGKMSD